MSTAAPVRQMRDFLDLHLLRSDKLDLSDAELNAAYTVLHELLLQVRGTELSKYVLAECVAPAILKGRFNDSIRTIELLILPFAAELAEAPMAAVRGTLIGFSHRSVIWNYVNTFFDAPYTLSRDPALILEATNELRVIAAVESIGLPMDVRRKVISQSENVLLMTLNSPLHILLKSRPDLGSEIVGTIKREHETDGERIAAMLDADCKPMASGIL